MDDYVSIYDAAIWYQEVCKWQVLPIYPAERGNPKSGKISLIRWRHRGPLSESELRRYFLGTKNNLAIRLDNLAVADCDTPEAETYVREHFGPTGWIQKSGSGGSHRIYRTTQTLRNRTNISDLGLDFKTGPGAYLVMPPSSHHSSGLYEILSAKALGVFDPSWLPPNNALQTLPPIEDSRERRRFRCRRYLAKLRSTTGQGGDTQLFRAACIAVQKFNLPADEAMEEMRIFNAYNCDPPWPESRLHYKVQEALRLKGNRNG